MDAQDPAHASADVAASQNAANAGPSSSAQPQVRSRITVVCAECKRLKLKCDRRTPCGSCLKRDTVVRCIYSPAAAEKIDLHSLNNRLLQVESTLAQLTTSPRAFSSAHSRMSSAIILCLQDLHQTWTEEIGIDISLGCGDTSTTQLRPVIKQEQHLSEVSFPDTRSLLQPLSDTNAAFSLPSTNIYQSDDQSRPSFSSSLYPQSSSQPHYQSAVSFNARPQITTKLLEAIPGNSASQRRYLDAAEKIMGIRPSFSWSRFRHRTEDLLSSHVSTDMTNYLEQGKISGNADRKEQARSIFFSPDKRKRRKTSGPGHEPDVHAETRQDDNVCFFSAICASLALGALSDEVNPLADASVSVDHSPRPSALLYSLSQQAMSVYESYLSQCATADNDDLNECGYDLDYLITGILQVVFILKSPTAGGASKAMGLVGKMVNVARQMGLGTDPDSYHSTMEEWEKEERRRIWWEIVWCDLYISDVMGHPPLLGEGSYSTKIPSERDAYFELKCKLVKLVRKLQARVQGGPAMSPSVKAEHKTYQSSSESSWAGGSYNLEQAGTFEAEVKALMADTNRALSSETSPLSSDEVRLMSSAGTSSSAGSAQSDTRDAQHCELIIMAYRLILRMYHPFLKQPAQSGESDSLSTEPWILPHQAAYAVMDASHGILHCSKTMYARWKSHGQVPDVSKFALVPALFDLYPLWRSVFDSFIVCAQSIVRQPSGILAKIALDDVKDVVDYYRANDEKNFSENAWGGLPFSEALAIMDAIKGKVGGGGTSVSLKRKHSAVDGSESSEASTIQTPTDPPPSAAAGRAAELPAPTDPAIKGKGLKGSKKSQAYPSHGVRVRPSKGLSSSSGSATSPTSVKSGGPRRRAASTSTKATNLSLGRVQTTAAHTPAPSTPALSSSASGSEVTFAFPHHSQEPTTSSLIQGGHQSHSRRGSISHDTPAPVQQQSTNAPAMSHHDSSAGMTDSSSSRSYDQYPHIRATAYEPTGSSSSQYQQRLPAPFERLATPISTTQPAYSGYSNDQPMSSDASYRAPMTPSSSYTQESSMATTHGSTSTSTSITSAYSHTQGYHYDNQQPQQHYSMPPSHTYHSQSLPMYNATTASQPRLYADAGLKSPAEDHQYMGGPSHPIHPTSRTHHGWTTPSTPHSLDLQHQDASSGSQYWSATSEQGNARYYQP